MRVPVLSSPRQVAPRALIQANRDIEAAETLRIRGERHRDEVDAREYLAALRAGQRPPLTRSASRGLVTIWVGEPDALEGVDLSELCGVVASAAPWPALWTLYQALTASPLESRFRELLGERLVRTLAEWPEDLRKLPEWLQEAARAGEARAGIREPLPYLQKWVEQHEVPLQRILGSVQLNESFPLGQLALVQLVKNGAPEWWRGHGTEQLLDWTHSRAQGTRAAVVERSLLEVGGNAGHPGDLQVTPQARKLLDWISPRFGSPVQHPGRWAPISERAQRLYRWFLLSQEIDGILSAFRRDANRDRAEFWQSYRQSIRDARCLTSSEGVAICLMVLGDLLVVEFGSTGNACYFYDVSGQATDLVSAKLGNRMAVSQFKQTVGGLRLGSATFPYRTKLSHSRYWTTNFAHSLAQHGIHPQRRKAGGRR